MRPLWKNIRSVLKRNTAVRSDRGEKERERKLCNALKEKEASIRRRGFIRKCDGEQQRVTQKQR